MDISRQPFQSPEFNEDRDGYTLRDAELADVEHYFVYNADLYAEAYLG